MSEEKQQEAVEELKKKYNKGLVFVHTGNGKGKTTAALGLALRAIGHGFKVVIIQFMKGRDYGETIAARQFLPDLQIIKCGQDSFVMRNPSALDIELAQKGMELAREVIEGGQCDLLILDEINMAIDFKLVALEDVLEMIKNKPDKLYLGLTGRSAAPEIIEIADLVTEMMEIKHPYNIGIPAQAGFEF